MKPNDMIQLASRDFSAVLSADPVLAALRSSLVDRKEFVPDTFDALLLGGSDHIGQLPVLPLTLAKWSFLWIIENPYATGEGIIDETGMNIFLYVLSHDLRNLHFPLAELAAQAGDYCLTTGLAPERIDAAIQDLISSAFFPLKMLPIKADDSSEKNFFDGAWISSIASVVVKESGMPYDRVIHELPLSLACNLYVAWRRRECADGNKIRRPQNDKIMTQIIERVNSLAENFLKGNGKNGNQTLDRT